MIEFKSKVLNKNEKKLDIIIIKIFYFIMIKQSVIYVNVFIYLFIYLLID